jgi:hypothetical protein
MTTTTLVQYVIEHFGRMAKDRIQHGENRVLVRIDDLGPKGAFPGYCDINVQFTPLDDNYTLILSHAPLNREIETLVRSHCGTVVNTDDTKEIRLALTATDSSIILEIATAIRRATAITPGQRRYPDPEWRWICPRAARSLEEFAYLLLDVCGSQRHCHRRRQGEDPRVACLHGLAIHS